ncbi:hypothetical protein EDS67_10825 [candidate division KSB1 bacterium]|nr:MAG: hypothetical protein EDS67_10825 [candidate division KSB1 bacterium]MCE7945283.1 hypothetical protein [Chlorobi bacterium CHB1]
MCTKLIVLRKGEKLFLTTCLSLFFGGCTETIYFYPPDKSQCITVITENWTRLRDLIDGRPNHSIRARYIIAGKHHTVPENNFVKLDVQYGDDYRADLYICWKNEQYEWEVVVHNAEIVESTLDTTRFNFSAALPADDRGFPTGRKFRKKGCAVFSFYTKRFSPDEGEAIVEFK